MSLAAQSWGLWWLQGLELRIETDFTDRRVPNLSPGVEWSHLFSKLGDSLKKAKGLLNEIC